MPIKTPKLFLLIAFLALLLFGIFRLASAQSIDELKGKINDNKTSIQQLEIEIQKYQDQIDAVGKEKDSLSNTLKSLDISKKKLEANTKVTESKIATKNLEIKELSLQIGDKGDRITDSKRVISQSFYNISQINSDSVIETLLGKKSLSDVWNGADQLSTLQGGMQDKIKDLKNLKTNLENNKKLTEKKKAELVALQNDLKSQAKIIADTVKEKNSILAETKNTEAGYKQLLASRQAEKAKFEKELFDYESALKIAIDPSLIATAHSGVFSWPLLKIKITQYFGATAFSKRLYVSGSHGGVDFGASIGTPVFAALSGMVTDTEPFKYRKGCQYGKFILIKHANGLSTLYGHLSSVNVNPGDTITTGQQIGYSGDTGYSFGPHLHFGVYATQGIRVVDARNLGSVSCAGIRTVAAPPEAYLDPMIYLPQ